MKKKITIEVDEDIVSNLADVLCYFAGFSDAKGEFWESSWLVGSVSSVKELKIEIESELKNNN